MTSLVPARKTGLLLVNLGTPDSPAPSDVRRYLRQLLDDPRVLDMAPLARWMLLNLVILPFRPRRSAEAYRQIWTPEGSPLLLHSIAFRDRLRERLGEGWAVELGMQCGRPTLAEGLDALLAADVSRIVVAPLYPQNAASMVGSALDATFRAAASHWDVPLLSALPAFFDDAGWVEAFAAQGRPGLASLEPDHVLFSFHGLPESHLHRGGPAGHCREAGCATALTAKNRSCYRAQCHESARLIAQRLGLADERWSVSFQSRLGRAAWLAPATEETVRELAGRGKKRLLVYCPSFVADCLETLEEIGLRAREVFVESGGERLELVPSLNASGPWVEAFARMLYRQSVFV